MKIRKILLLLLVQLVFFTASCGIIQEPSPPPQLSATDIPPRATALSALPPTWTPVPTPTPIPPSPTALPTQDPENYRITLVLTPAAEPFPAEVIDRSNWKEMAGNTASVEIPPGYEVIDFAGTFLELMFGLMEAMAEGLTEMALEIGEEIGATPEAEQPMPELGEMPEIDVLIAAEDETSSAILLVSVETTPDTTTEDLINQALSGQENPFRPISWTSYSNVPFPIDRVILSVEDPEHGPGKQALYVILGEQMGWNVIFTSPAETFENNLPAFESVIQSFRIDPDLENK